VVFILRLPSFSTQIHLWLFKIV